MDDFIAIFTQKKHPQYKPKSAMYKRRYKQYKKQVEDYINYFNRELPIPLILNRLYPENKRPDCLKIIFET